VVWEAKPKKKARWKPMSVKHTEKLEKEFREYTEASPLEDKVVELDNIPVSSKVLMGTCSFTVYFELLLNFKEKLTPM
jgi:hypothetical protein